MVLVRPLQTNTRRQYGTLENLQAKIAALTAQAEAIVKRDSTGVIAKIRGPMEKHGLTTVDIDAHIGGAKKRGRKPGVEAAAKSSTSAAKYRDPKTGATWTGEGRAPTWIATANAPRWVSLRTAAMIRCRSTWTSDSVATELMTWPPAQSNFTKNCVTVRLKKTMSESRVWKIPSERLIAPSGPAGFRVVTKIHPFWNIYLNGLAISLVEALEP